MKNTLYAVRRLRSPVRPYRRHYVFIQSNLNRVVGNCNRQLPRLARDKPWTSMRYGDRAGRLGRIGAFIAVEPCLNGPKSCRLDRMTYPALVG